MTVIHKKIFALSAIAVLSTGCSSVSVTKNPGDGDRGIRYYRPKPYLLVTPAEPTGRMVNLKLQYLPDFNEEYSIHPKGKKVQIALKDGWNLVGVNAGEAPKDKDEPPPPPAELKMPEMVVAATNVPMGYYESVYDYVGQTKQLRGWRYIGFDILGGASPTSPQHLNPASPCAGAQNGQNPLYGMVFFNGVMTFRRIEEIAANQLCPSYVNLKPPGSGQVAPVGVVPPPVVPPVVIPDRVPETAPPTPAPRNPVVNPAPGDTQYSPAVPSNSVSQMPGLPPLPDRSPAAIPMPYANAPARGLSLVPPTPRVEAPVEPVSFVQARPKADNTVQPATAVIEMNAAGRGNNSLPPLPPGF